PRIGKLVPSILAASSSSFIFTNKLVNMPEIISHGSQRDSVSESPKSNLGKRPRSSSPPLPRQDIETQRIKSEEEIEGDEESSGTETEREIERPTPEQQVFSLYRRALANDNPNFKICCPDGRVFYWERDDLLDLVQRNPFWLTTTQMDTCLHLCLEDSETWEARCHICYSDTIGQQTALSKTVEDAADTLKQQLQLLLQDVQYNLIPLNLDHHWHLVIICGLEGQTSTNPQIWHLNSLEFFSINEEMINAIKQVVEEKTGKPAAWSDLQVPQQDNSYDCGIFVIKFVFQFIKNLGSPQPQDFTELMARQAHNECFGINLSRSFQRLMLWTLFQKQTDPPLQVLPVDFDEYIKAFCKEDHEDPENNCGKDYESDNSYEATV
ncbi:hypothetical protein SUGI_1487510, partial [Cryptomeria japonica]